MTEDEKKWLKARTLRRRVEMSNASERELLSLAAEVDRRRTT